MEILPSAFPIDATEHFSRGLLPYVRYLLADPTLASASEDGHELREALQRATLVKDGKLTEKHEWLYGLLEEAKAGAKRQRAVVLGAGCALLLSSRHLRSFLCPAQSCCRSCCADPRRTGEPRRRRWCVGALLPSPPGLTDIRTQRATTFLQQLGSPKFSSMSSLHTWMHRTRRRLRAWSRERTLS